MKNRFTIGEMAKLHHIPIKTLRYYDEIGLFKPIEVDSKSGYRYYAAEQFELLDLICYLKMVGVPLKEIQKQVQNRELSEFLTLFSSYKEANLKKIKQLQLMNERLTARIDELTEAKHIQNLGIPFTKKVEARRIVEVKNDIRSLYDLELSLRHVKKDFHHVSPIIISKVGLTLSVEAAKLGKYFDYSSVFLLIEESELIHMEESASRLLEEGIYASIYFREPKERTTIYYDRLLDYVKTHEYETEGPLIVRDIIDQFLSNRPQEHVTEIQVKVRKKD
ncbi:MerR family transcriptional regulator [Priestia koreensis]|uniref:Multidrug transporter n=1 Tax=Priestia koreensis TaxID=284581 RepID=A0A0M0KQR3_9BACI|nr:MerR family transcriptional regulator [Priestia koreensis]KOO41154.1 multidrug transporter [Priestia koreensis]